MERRLNPTKALAQAFGELAGVILLLVAATMWRGYVIAVLWSWFVVPTFKAPLLSIPAAIGVALVLNFATTSVNELKKSEMSDGERWVKSAMFPALALFFGWIVQHWM